MDVKPGVADLHNWAPFRVYWVEGQPMIDWCYMGETRFTQPFFDTTIGSQFTRPFSAVFRHRTPIDVLAGVVEHASCVPPTGFIFHMSRCGSTLVSQMFAALARNIVISEAPPIDSVLRANIYNPAVTDEQRVVWLRWIIGALGRRQTGAEDGYFVKFDSWSTLYFDVILRAFPDVPWVFVFRNTVEVMVSQLGKPGVQMIRGAIDRLLPGLPVMEALQMPAEEYCARVLERFCLIALGRLASGNGIAIDYAELPDAVTGRIAGHFGVSFSPAEIEKMNAVAGFDAKTPGIDFTPDAEAKRGMASDLVRRLAAERLDPLYEKLRAAAANI